jgi:hypothetical protein
MLARMPPGVFFKERTAKRKLEEKDFVDYLAASVQRDGLSFAQLVALVVADAGEQWTEWGGAELWQDYQTLFTQRRWEEAADKLRLTFEVAELVYTQQGLKPAAPTAEAEQAPSEESGSEEEAQAAPAAASAAPVKKQKPRKVLPGTAYDDEMKKAVEAVRKRYPELWTHIFKGVVEGNAVKGYHSQLYANGPVRAYGKRTDLGGGVYSQSVWAPGVYAKEYPKGPKAGQTKGLKADQSTFFPDALPEAEIMEAVLVVLARRDMGFADRSVPIWLPNNRLAGMKLWIIGEGADATVFPNVGQKTQAALVPDAADLSAAVGSG